MRFRIEANQDCLSFWPLEDQSDATMYRLAHFLDSWGFGPDRHGPRAATGAEILSVADMGNGAIAEWVREKGITWYEWPLVVQRAKEHSAGPGLDDLADELARRGNKISFADLSGILQSVRFRNLPPGRTARSYTC